MHTSHDVPVKLNPARLVSLTYIIFPWDRSLASRISYAPRCSRVSQRRGTDHSYGTQMRLSKDDERSALIFGYLPTVFSLECC